MLWPTWLDEAGVQAKSPEMGGETLAQHTWDVLSRLGDQVRLRPWLPALLGERIWPGCTGAASSTTLARPPPASRSGCSVSTTCGRSSATAMKRCRLPSSTGSFPRVTSTANG